MTQHVIPGDWIPLQLDCDLAPCIVFTFCIFLHTLWDLFISPVSNLLLCNADFWNVCLARRLQLSKQTSQLQWVSILMVILYGETLLCSSYQNRSCSGRRYLYIGNKACLLQGYFPCNFTEVCICNPVIQVCLYMWHSAEEQIPCSYRMKLVMIMITTAFHLIDVRQSVLLIYSEHFCLILNYTSQPLHG